jgi:hypothetical protein
MQTVYLETSVVSYCASRQSRNIIIAARQQETRDWWYKYSQKYEIFISQQVVDEASDGDQEAAADRLRVIEGLTLLALTDDSLVLAEHLVLTNAIPWSYNERPPCGRDPRDKAATCHSVRKQSETNF